MTHIRSLLTTLNFSLLATILIAQQNIDLWQGLIQASGDMLNPAKCSWMPFLWVFNCFGNAWLAEPPQRPWYLLSISNKEGQCHPIQRNLPSMAVWLLGVQISANGCYKKELEVLMQCQAQYVDCLNCTPLIPQEAHVIYHQCNLPKVTYPLPTTNMPPEKNYSSQSKVTSLFWTRWGIPNISPHCIVYAPTSIGGLGFIHLGIEQGQQVLQLFHHKCTSAPMVGYITSSSITTNYTWGYHTQSWKILGQHHGVLQAGYIPFKHSCIQSMEKLSFKTHGPQSSDATMTNSSWRMYDNFFLMPTNKQSIMSHSICK